MPVKRVKKRGQDKGQVEPVCVEFTKQLAARLKKFCQLEQRTLRYAVCTATEMFLDEYEARFGNPDN